MGRGSGSAELAMAAAPVRCPDCPGPERGGGGGTPPVPHLGIAVDEGDVLPGALRIVRQLRPAWDTATVKTKVQHQDWILLLHPGVKEVDYGLYPSKEMQLQWLHSYLQAYKELTQGHPGDAQVSQEELESLYVQVNKFSLASHFLWACWGLIQDKYSTIDFNFLRYAKLRFKQYFKMKPVVTALQVPK
ncbi:hypothetical protein TURU_148944 [Turdus rufiventris]|nr:hypothetical protein TURU_148944 [Turdus rufiventris]